MAKISGFNNVDFNKEKAQARLDDFLRANPDASAKLIEQRTRQIVAEEAIVFSLMESYKQNVGDVPRTEEEIRNWEEKLRSSIDLANGKPKAVALFVNNYDGKYFSECLKKVQGGVSVGYRLENIIKDFNAFTHGVVADEMISSTQNIGKAASENLFARKVDLTNTPYVLSDPEQQKTLNKWRKDIPGIEIKVPENLKETVDDRMIEFLVFSEMMKDDNLAKCEAALRQKGSTLPSVVDRVNTARTAFYDNFVGASDMRLNMMSSFYIIPECRRNVNKMLADGTKEDIDNSIRHAFNELYTSLAVSFHGNSKFNYSVKKLNELIDLSKEKGIDLNISKEQTEMIYAANVKREYSMRMEELGAELSKANMERIFSDGKDPESDVSKNPALLEKIQEFTALSAVFGEMTTEFQKLAKDTYCYFTNDDSYMAKRSLTPTEKMLAENPSGLVNVYKQRLRQLDTKGDLNKVDVYKNLHLVKSGSLSPMDFKGLTIFDHEVFEKQLAGKVFSDTLDFFENFKNSAEYEEVGDFGREFIDGGISCVKRIQEKRRGYEGEALTEEIVTDLAEDYKELGRMSDEFAAVQANPDFRTEAGGLLFDQAQRLSTMLSSYASAARSFNAFKERINATGTELAAGYKPKETLFGVAAYDIGKLKWGVTKGEHAVHLFAAGKQRNDIVEIDSSKEPERSTTKADQKEVYNTLSASLTRTQFKSLAKTAAEMFEDVSLDPKLKGVLLNVRDYVTAENRAAQQSTLLKLQKSISTYKKGVSLKNPVLKRNLDKLGLLEKSLNAFTNGNLMPDPNSASNREAAPEPNTTGIGGITKWTAVEGELFPHDPSPTDIKQGRLNDCFALSCITSIANSNPQKIRDMMRDNGDGTVSVRFYNTTRNMETREWIKNPVDIRVKKTVPKTLAGHAVYSSSSLWVQMFEKAYAVFVTDHYRDGMGNDKFSGNKKLKGYERLEHGNPGEFLECIESDSKLRFSGGRNNASFFTENPGRYNLKNPKPEGYNEVENEYFNILSEANKGTPVIVGTNPEDKARGKYCLDHGIRTQHAYTVMGTFEKEVGGRMKKFVTLRDPFASFSAKYDEKGNLTDNSELITATRRAGADNMGQFNLEYADYLRMFDSITGAPEALISKVAKMDFSKTVLNEKVEEKQEVQQENQEPKKINETAENKNGGIADDFDITDVNDFDILEDKEPEENKLDSYRNTNNDRIASGLEKFRKAYSAIGNKELNSQELPKEMLSGLSECISAYTINQMLDKVGENMSNDELNALTGADSFAKSTADFKKFLDSLDTKKVLQIAETVDKKGVKDAYKTAMAEVQNKASEKLSKKDLKADKSAVKEGNEKNKNEDKSKNDVADDFEIINF